MVDFDTETAFLPADIRLPLDKHLDAVEAAMTRSGQTREARRAIVDDLEVHLLQSLRERTQGRPPTLDDVITLIKDADPPEAYVEHPGTESLQHPVPSIPISIEKRPKAKGLSPVKALFLTSLVVCGAMLVGIPAFVGLMDRAQAAQVLQHREDLTSVSLTRSLSDWQCFGLWFTGTAAILSAVFVGVRSLKTQPGN